MSAKVIELYEYVKRGQASSLSCNVVYSGAYGTHIFSGFLSEDINFAVQSDYGNSMPSSGIKMIDKIKETATKAVDTVSNAMNNIDGSGGVFNPLNSRQLWNSTTPPSFSVEVHLFTLSSSDDVIAKAKQALFLTSPRIEGSFLISPGKYEFPLNEAFGGHANNLWAIQMGNHFTASWLICTNLSVTISKEHVRFNDPNDLGETRSTKPLYITLKFDFSTDRMRFAEEMQAMLDGGAISVEQTNSGQTQTNAKAPVQAQTADKGESKASIQQTATDAIQTAGNAIKGIFGGGKSNEERAAQAKEDNLLKGRQAQVNAATNNAWSKGVG